MSKHPEILWAQRSSETVKEKVGTYSSSVLFTFDLLGRRLLLFISNTVSIRMSYM